jgi:hypothetical protein
MALAHCILGKFLGVGCHCFPPVYVITKEYCFFVMDYKIYELWCSFGSVCLESNSFSLSDCYLRSINSRYFEEFSIIVPIYKKGDTTDCNNYKSITICVLFYPVS